MILIPVKFRHTHTLRETEKRAGNDLVTWYYTEVSNRRMAALRSLING